MPKHLVRYQNSTDFHFITFSCYRRLPLLARDDGYHVFEQELERVRQRYEMIVTGYVLMPEHVHLLISEPLKGNLATAIQALKHQSSRKLKSQSEPQFWQRRYFDFNVWKQTKIWEKLEYIHQNPVARGLVANPEDWPWSSSRHYVTGEAGTVEIESGRTAQERELENQHR